MKNIERLNPQKLGLVIVDLQKGYCELGSDWETNIGGDVREAEKVCQAHVPFLDAARALLKPNQIMWFRMEERPETIAQNMHYAGLFKPEETLCVRGTPGHDYHIVGPKSGEAEFLKFHMSGFSCQAFQEYLKSNDVSQLVVTGVIGSRCVNATILGASERGYECIALTDLIGGPAGLKEEMERHYGVTNFFYALPLPSSEFLQHLRAKSQPIPS